MKNKTFKQKLSFMLILSILISMLTLTNVFATEYKTEVPAGYIGVYTAEDLDNIRDNLNGKYILMNHIDLSGEDWIPIGDLSTPFKGVLDGNNYVIENLTINSPYEGYLGLFGRVNNTTDTTDTPNILNLGLVNIDIVGSGNCIGGIAGEICGSIVENCYATGVINYKDIEGTTQSCFGGLFGESFNSKIYNSYSNVTVNGVWMVGGLIGFISNGSKVENCYSEGEVNGVNNGVGGFAGNIGSGCRVKNCYSTGKVSSIVDTYIGGFIGKKNGIVFNSYYNSETSGMSDEGKGTPLTTEQMKQQSSFIDWDFTNIWTIQEDLDYPKLQWQSEPEAESPISGNKIYLKKGTNTVKLDKEEVEIQVIKAGEKDVGTYLTLYKKVLEDVDASQNNKVLTKINNFLTNLFSK